MATIDDQLSQDVVFDILSSPRRRYMIHYLRSNEGKEEVTELAKHVAAWEYEVDLEALTDQQQKRVYVSLYQTHVPKLADIGVVTYDEETRMVELTDRASNVEAYVSSDTTSDQPWPWYYLTLSGLGFVVLAFAGFDVPPLAGVPDIFPAAVVAIVFAGLAAAHIAILWRGGADIPEELRMRE